ncbi:MAG: phage minor capsid protein [Clostridia bacterium]|nr:phage minor capsid protein [Clostridia bacterium]
MSIRTDLNALLLEELFQMYTDAEIRMMEKVAKRVKRGVTEIGWTEEKLGDVRQLRKEIEATMGNANRLAKAKLSKGIISAYFSGVASANKDHGIPASIMKDLKLPAHLQRLVLEANNLIDGTSIQILRHTQDVYRSVMAEANTSTLMGVDTRVEAAQRSLNMFAAKGITGFVDTVGRRWDMASYVEMAGRTLTAHAALQGHFDRQGEIGNDLVIVSSFGTTCPICAPWGGKVLSISGKTAGYSTLDQAKSAGLFHPNCKHTITAYFPEIDEPEQRHIHQRQYNPEKYDQIQEQRYNEIQIRRWKRTEAAAITPVDQKRARQKVAYWQARQRAHIQATGLKRKYGRENPNRAR